MHIMTANCTFPGEVCFATVLPCGADVWRPHPRKGHRVWGRGKKPGVSTSELGCIRRAFRGALEYRMDVWQRNVRELISPHISPYLPPFDVDEGPAQQLKATLDSAMDLLKPEEGDGHHLMDHGPGKTSPPTMAPWSWWRV